MLVVVRVPVNPSEQWVQGTISTRAMMDSSWIQHRNFFTLAE